MNYPTPRKIKEELAICEQQIALANKRNDGPSYVYWTRKYQAGKFLLWTYPTFIMMQVNFVIIVILLVVKSWIA